MTEEDGFKALAAYAAATVPQKILKVLREKPPVLEIQVEEEMSENQRQEIQSLSGNFRYDFVCSSNGKPFNIYCEVPRDEIQKNVDEYCSKRHRNTTLEIWQGTSEAIIEERKGMSW